MQVNYDAQRLSSRARVSASVWSDVLDQRTELFQGDMCFVSI